MRHRQKHFASVQPVKLAIALVLAGFACGCGGGHAERTVSTTAAAKPAVTRAQMRELTQLHADIRRIKIVAAPVHHSLMGTPKLMAATGKFLDDEQRASLDNLTKNHLISLAASAVAGSCDQCFQQLEAARPIPAIAHPTK